MMKDIVLLLSIIHTSCSRIQEYELYSPLYKPKIVYKSNNVVEAKPFLQFGTIFGENDDVLPKSVDQNKWWGPDDRIYSQDTKIRRFRITFDKEKIEDLQCRLKHHNHIQGPLQGVGFNYGFNSHIIDEWTNYWADAYDFKERERFLNQFPMYTTNIQGLNIQFIWTQPKVPHGINVVPLLLLHGWPGSIREFYEAIPFLSEVQKGRDYALELIVPSIPGFGYSEGTSKPNMGVAEIAVIFKNLMLKLGHKQFYIQGGDMGHIICSMMATLYPEDILGFHTNLAVVLSTTALAMNVIGSLYPPMVVEPHLWNRIYPLWDTISFLMTQSGYLHEQATKPDTIGVAVSDSPAGLLAYTLEKFSAAFKGTNLTDGALSSLNKDPLIDNLMLYWMPNSVTTSFRLYAETFNKRHFNSGLEGLPTSVPTWALQAKHEIIYQPPIILRTKYTNLLNTTVLEFGTHFFAFELPKVFADDILMAIGEFRKWHSRNHNFTSIRQTMENSLLKIISSIHSFLTKITSFHVEAWWIIGLFKVIVEAIIRIICGRIY